MSTLRAFDPHRDAPERAEGAPKPAKAPKVGAPFTATLGGLGTLGAADPAPAEFTAEDLAYAREALRRAYAMFSPEVLADEAEVTLRGELE